MAESVEYHGGLVAFEGPNDLVTTQLHLLPTSSQIAILPSVKEFLEPEVPDEPFEARKFIKRVHNAVAKRRETALAFLKESTPKCKRLVFMNGGTPSSQTACIRAISRNVTDGDVSKAEVIFNDIIQGGVAGLDQHPSSPIGSFLNASEEPSEDPITRAMRAADALYRETASLQPCSDIDLTISSTRPRSMSLPLYTFAGSFGDTAPFYVFGGQRSEEDAEDEERSAQAGKVFPPTPTLAITNFDELERLSKVGVDHEGKPIMEVQPRSPSCAGEAYERESMFLASSRNSSAMLDVASPGSDSLSIRSTEPIVIEEASLVRMKSSSSRKALRRSQSIDQLHRGTSRYRDTLMRLKPRENNAGEIIPDDDQRASVIKLIEDAEQRESNSKLFGNPKTVYVKPHRTNHKGLMPPPSGLKTPEKPKQTKPNYVDRGTDAVEIVTNDAPFQPVLPFYEDLVIHFKDDSPDPILEYIIKSLKECANPVPMPSTPSSVTSAADGESSVPHTPTSPTGESQANPFTSATTVNTEDYDPFSYEDQAYKTKQITRAAAQPVVASALPTPAHTPPPTVSEPEDKFHDFNTGHGQTAVAMQNSLRSILNIYFPPEGRGFSQFDFPLLPEMDGLWKPIFRDTEPDGTSKKGNRRRIDQIVAIGSQRGVKRTFFSAVTSQLERLGTKLGGVSRTGRLDFRYLIANAMQSFTSQPLANQTHDNPFTNSYLLATLIIPHLETYFAVHSEVRFLLLDYPPEHLATILALQQLVGVDLMKVAQVIDAGAKSSFPFAEFQDGSKGPTSNGSDAASSIISHQSKESRLAANSSSRDGIAISKANLILMSTATDGEVATFISTIWTVLVNISKFYLPDIPVNHGESVKAKRRSRNFSPFLQSPLSPPMSPPPSSGKKTGGTAGSIRKSRGPSSITETILSCRVKSLRGERRGFGDGASITTIDMDYESDLYLEERRLMPLFSKKKRERKGNSHKALKFLGLA